MVWPAIIGAAAGLGIAGMNTSSQRHMAADQIMQQREFAQHGIRWKVADAKAAGLHPLAALGMQPSSFSPVSIPGDDGSAQMLAQLGQDISRAQAAKATEQERKDADATMFMLEAARRSDERVYRAQQEAREDRRLALDETNAHLRNMVLLDQLKRKEAPGQPPPTPGKPPSMFGEPGTRGRVKVNPAEQTARSPHDASKTAASAPFWMDVETVPGITRQIPNPDLNLDAELAHSYAWLQAMADKGVRNFFGGPWYRQVPRPTRGGARTVMPRN